MCFMRKGAAFLSVLLFLTLAFPVAAKTASPRAKAQERVENAKLKTCQNRQAKIESRMASLIRFAENMMEKFDSISTRVQNFYTNKVLPRGKTAPNYDALVADVMAKKDIVADTLTEAQASLDSFTCDTDSPRNLYNQFKTDMQAVKRALHAYRTSIKNLILGVHRISGGVGDASASPTPTASPISTESPILTPSPTATPTP